ncbi:hypothetical protein POM88_023617 [Heracleum sosnowskyi]|uniref:NPH3 domain-containing protein n=1 Tax=Heracleum sosnowskyi TaxID=360622 RepID=A0AAD8GQB5_9APIA|nr:hypothetical protein POM88_053670 [Heracleum sosnowskyi]KAK1385882.1 hypothetical protein POM88_023617 [Heracleum sosnowskyi]
MEFEKSYALWLFNDYENGVDYFDIKIISSDIDKRFKNLEHPEISKSERKKTCKLMNCKKLSADACAHAVQNKRLPLRVVVQVLFFEQARAAASSGFSTPDLPEAMKNLNNGLHGSSRSATTNDCTYK